MNYDKIKNLIEENREIVNFGKFGEGVSEIWISKAEDRLGVKLPESYKWWLKNYGGGEINGDEVFSIYELDFDSVVGGDIVYINELNRKNGLTNNKQLVIQENDQGEIYYFNLEKSNSDSEYLIYSDVSGDEYASDFIEFLTKKIME